MNTEKCVDCNEFNIDPVEEGYGFCGDTRLATAIPGADEYPISVAEAFGCIYWCPKQTSPKLKAMTDERPIPFHHSLGFDPQTAMIAAIGMTLVDEVIHIRLNLQRKTERSKA